MFVGQDQLGEDCLTYSHIWGSQNTLGKKYALHIQGFHSAERATPVQHARKCLKSVPGSPCIGRHAGLRRWRGRQREATLGGTHMRGPPPLTTPMTSHTCPPPCSLPCPPPQLQRRPIPHHPAPLSPAMSMYLSLTSLMRYEFGVLGLPCHHTTNTVYSGFSGPSK